MNNTDIIYHCAMLSSEYHVVRIGCDTYCRADSKDLILSSLTLAPASSEAASDLSSMILARSI